MMHKLWRRRGEKNLSELRDELNIFFYTFYVNKIKYENLHFLQEVKFYAN